MKTNKNNESTTRKNNQNMLKYLITSSKSDISASFARMYVALASQHMAVASNSERSTNNFSLSICNLNNNNKKFKIN